MTPYVDHVFDMDGVILQTPDAKARSFYAAALPYGTEAAEAMVRLHRGAGSESRRGQWERFFADILARPPESGEVDAVYDACTRGVLDTALTAPLVPGIVEYLAMVQHASVVTGVLTREATMILRHHGLDRHFRGIWGGPRRKPELFRTMAAQGEIVRPAVYFGDTMADWQASTGAGLDFVLIRCCSAWGDWAPSLCRTRSRSFWDFEEIIARGGVHHRGCVP